MNPQYQKYVGGRIEVYNGTYPYTIKEIRFFTDKRKKFMKFRDKWDMEYITEAQLKQVESIVESIFLLVIPEPIEQGV